MTQHTPGPWKKRTCFTKGEPVEYAIDSKHPEHSGPVAAVYITVDNDDQDEANARLIAAAPDLLEACEELIAIVGTLTVRSAKEAVAIRLASAAIAKATREPSQV